MNYQLRQSLPKASVGSIEIDQRIAGMRFPRDNVADDDGVIANFDNPVQAALDDRERSSQNRRAGLTSFPIDAFKPAFGLFSERHREFTLLFGQNIDCEKRSLPEMIYRRTAEIDADENQRGFDRNGRK